MSTQNLLRGLNQLRGGVESRQKRKTAQSLAERVKATPEKYEDPELAAEIAGSGDMRFLSLLKDNSTSIPQLFAYKFQDYMKETDPEKKKQAAKELQKIKNGMQWVETYKQNAALDAYGKKLGMKYAYKRAYEGKDEDELKYKDISVNFKGNINKDKFEDLYTVVKDPTGDAWTIGEDPEKRYNQLLELGKEQFGSDFKSKLQKTLELKHGKGIDPIENMPAAVDAYLNLTLQKNDPRNFDLQNEMGRENNHKATQLLKGKIFSTDGEYVDLEDEIEVEALIPRKITNKKQRIEKQPAKEETAVSVDKQYKAIDNALKQAKTYGEKLDIIKNKSGNLTNEQKARLLKENTNYD